MRILALDTTTRVTSCAAVDGHHVLRTSQGDAARPLATRLPLDMMELLDEVGWPLSSVEAFVVCVGPGSFTGLRIGIASMQGLASAAGKPLVGISGLDALARYATQTVPRPRQVVTWIDAWRGEVYAAHYTDGAAAEAPVVEQPSVLLDAWAHAAAQDAAAAVWIGDGAGTYRDLITTRLGSLVTVATPPSPPLAGMVGLLGAERLAAGERPVAADIQPLYVRRPDAVLALERRVSDGGRL